MKVCIVFAACIISSVVSASSIHYGPAAAPLVSTGTSSQFREEDNYGNYNFGYDEEHSTGSSSRREESTNGVRRGSYSLSDADGRRRVVTYIADENGFRATVESNEPGVEPKDSADVLVNKGGAAPIAVAAPIHVPAPAPAPIYSTPVVAAPVVAAVKGYNQHIPAPVTAVKGYSQHIVPAAPVYHQHHHHQQVAAPVVVEPATPRAFRYSFGSTHRINHALPAPLPAPIAGPVYQQRIANDEY